MTAGMPACTQTTEDMIGLLRNRADRAAAKHIGRNARWTFMMGSTVLRDADRPYPVVSDELLVATRSQKIPKALYEPPARVAEAGLDMKLLFKVKGKEWQSFGLARWDRVPLRWQGLLCHQHALLEAIPNMLVIFFFATEWEKQTTPDFPISPKHTSSKKNPKILK